MKHRSLILAAMLIAILCGCTQASPDDGRNVWGRGPVTPEPIDSVKVAP